MNHRQRALAVLNYQPYDRLPIVHFGFLRDTLRRWAREGHISHELAEAQADANAADMEIGRRLGFDFNWQSVFTPNGGLRPAFEHRVLEEMPDGWRKVLTANGVVILEKDDARGIPPEVDHLLKGRAEWDEHFVPRMQFRRSEWTHSMVRTPSFEARFDAGGREFLLANAWEQPLGLHCGSLYGWIRNWLGVIGSCYLQADDPALFDEIDRDSGRDVLPLHGVDSRRSRWRVRLRPLLGGHLLQERPADQPARLPRRRSARTTGGSPICCGGTASPSSRWTATAGSTRSCRSGWRTA